MKTLIFDLGGVLLDFSHARMCKQMAEICELPIESIQKLLFEEGWGDRIERGTFSSAELHTTLCKLSGKNLSFEDLIEAASDIFAPKPAMIPLLSALKKEGHQLLLLSNTCEAHFSFAKRHFPFLTLFDRWILSYEVGARKPEAAIYFEALRSARNPIQNCLYIDDIPEYVAAGRQLGLPSHHFVGAEPLLQVLRSYQII